MLQGHARSVPDVPSLVERLTHRPNVSLGKQRANTGLIARQSRHGPPLLESSKMLGRVHLRAKGRDREAD